MFKEQNQKGAEEIETIIGPSVNVEGDFSSKGNMTVQGSVSGTLKTERDLKIGVDAKITADVWAANAFVAGEIRGNVKIGEKMELTETAKIFGDIEVKTLIMAPGAILNGRCTMSHEGVSSGEGDDDNLKKDIKK
ncbi:MAG TPA: polymer-forming cytoskeletal protein [Patescibacteria group bacterium]|nr:polymer-forming cytoskeletal protein [Patescibacteria group bacterium]